MSIDKDVALKGVLANSIESGLIKGVQLCVFKGEEIVAHCAEGTAYSGIACDSEILLNWQCAAKPILALMIGNLVDAGLLSFDARVAEYFPEFAAAGKDQFTIRNVLSHICGYVDDDPPIIAVFPPVTWDRLRAIASAAVPDPSRRYSVWVGWAALGVVAQAVLNADLSDAVESTILRPLGCEVANLTVRDDCPVNGVRLPASVRRGYTRLMCERISPGTSFWSNALDMAQLYRRLIGIRNGLPDDSEVIAAETLQGMLAPPMGPTRRTVRGLGFELASMEFGPGCSVDTFGHTAEVGMAFGDPIHELAVAIFVNHSTSPPIARQFLSEVSAAVYREFVE